MEMEKINDNTIRVLLETDDLTERGITVLDLLGNHKEIENFFYSILEEVDVDHEFRENDAVTFQLLPNRNGLELFISKVSAKDEEKMNFDNEGEQQSDDLGDSDVVDLTFLDPNKKIPEDVRKKIASSLSKLTPKEKTVSDDGDGVSGYLKDKDIKRKHYVIAFAEFEDFIQAAKVLKNRELGSNLYLLDGRLYLDIIFFVDQTNNQEIEDTLSLLAEFGKRVSLSYAILQERGKRLMTSSALELARYYFK
ncbi:adaptor protein [Liquorilactobacillus ghanensis DSM 18630]|jgi:adapter protein MecA 1/2|uniref:Adapter protein MecA n=1 Tax=Liquorilactobacillus ghanensis DSM 18630 TaxID=1423750 RepID=A0A0R1VLI7_9LACO|nr:adaptor protein MecA [Liquorilactobacillus ghanensis]KRM06522.1 adaptor protein [Liquorilactobacillus ghanensis DSM 18630]